MRAIRHFPPHDKLTGVISAMVVWAVYFAAVYALAGVGCEAGWHRRRLVPFDNLLTASMVGLTAVALLSIAWCGWRGWCGWRRGDDIERTEARQRARFMGLVMFVLACLAATGTVLVAIPIFMLLPCA